MKQRAELSGFLLTFLWVPLFFIPQSTHSQSQLEVTIQQFGADEVRGYMQPLGDMFGANMNAGLYHSAAMKGSGFHLRIEIVGIASLVRDEHRMYNAILPAGFSPQGGSLKTATVFGGEGTTFRDVNSGLEYKGSDGVFNLSLFPMFVPQLTIGTLYGTEATIRYITTPPLAGGKLPSSTLWGFGIRHSITQYLGQFPVDATLGIFYSAFSVGDVLESQASALDLQVSRSVLLFTFYGGFAVGRSSTKLHYTYRENESSSPTLVDLSMDGNSRFRVTTGLQIDLQAITLFADANFGKIQHVTGGIGFGF